MKTQISRTQFVVLVITFYLIFFTSVLNIIYQFHHAVILALVGSVFHSTLVIINNTYLIPKFFTKKRYFIYFLLVFITLLGLSWTRAYIEFQYFPFVPERFMDFKNQINDTFFPQNQFFPKEMMLPPPIAIGRPVFLPAIFMSNLLIWSLSFGFYFGKAWFTNQQLEAERKNENLETELKFLKSQLNPHFLFNTLNNIYSFTYIKDERAAPMLMKLSEMLRYMLYDCNEALVSLEKEIQFLKNFIDLQKMKTNKLQNIDFQLEGNMYVVSIAPLLLLPFFENSFKHSDLDINANGFIKISLQVVDKQQLYFEMQNTKRKTRSNQKENSGIGLENVKKRLELLYPQKHEFKIEDTEDVFKVKLRLIVA
jgi:two-component system, LytTR family, sensor kinase